MAIRILSFFVSFYLALLLFQAINGAIVCWNCNAGSHEECWGKGKFMECDHPNDICATVVRRQGNRNQIRKHCKGIDACINDQQQNWNMGSYSQCTPHGQSSVCRCCCFNDYCNRNETCKPVNVATSCRDLPDEFQHGEITCTNSNRVGSVCSFTCTNERYQLNPATSQTSTCLPNGKWSRPIPCCSLPCPPHLMLDLIILIHLESGNEIIRLLHNGVSGRFIRRVNFGPNGVHYARLHYASDVYRPFLSFNDTFNSTGEEILDRLKEAASNQESDGRVNTGRALWYAYHNIVKSEERRPNVPLLVIVHSDANSDDDVAPAAKALRDAGAKIAAYNVMKPGSHYVNKKQLYDMNGYASRRSVIQQGSDVDHDWIFQDFCQSSCSSYV